LSARVGSSIYGRRREIALRHVRARAVARRADFVETTALLEEHGAPLREALRIAARVHRGGGLAREAVYLAGAPPRRRRAPARPEHRPGARHQDAFRLDAAPVLARYRLRLTRERRALLLGYAPDVSDEPLPTLANARYAIAKSSAKADRQATFEAVDKRQGALVVLKRFRVRGATSWKEVELASARPGARRARSREPAEVRRTLRGERRALALTKRSRARASPRGGPAAAPSRSRRCSGFSPTPRRDSTISTADPPPVIHRDIKPSNVIVPARRIVRVDRLRLGPRSSQAARREHRRRTFGFMAPEQFQGRAWLRPTSTRSA